MPNEQQTKPALKKRKGSERMFKFAEHRGHGRKQSNEVSKHYYNTFYIDRSEQSIHGRHDSMHQTRNAQEEQDTSQPTSMIFN